MSKTIDTIADRMLFSVFSVPSQKNIADALVTQYPHPVDEKSLLAVKMGVDKTKHIVFTAAKNTNRIFNKTLSSTLLTIGICKNMSGNFIFIGDTFIEYITLQKGALMTSVAQKRITEKPVYEQIAAFPGEPQRVICTRRVARELAESKENKYSEKIYEIESITERQKRQASFTRYTRSYKQKQLFSFIGCALVLVFLGTMGMYRYRQKYATEDTKNRQVLEEQRQAAQMQKEQETKLQQLLTEYDLMAQNSLPSAYFVCSVIFSCIEAKTKIENLSIAGYTFQLDALGLDAIKTLAEFEKNASIQSIQLSRTVMDENQSQEIFSFNGIVKRLISHPDPKLPLEKQIAFYERENQRNQTAIRTKSERLPSDYSNAMRRLILSHDCQIQSIQYYGTEYGLEIDCTIRSRSVDFFSFLYSAAQEAAGVDISSIRIRNFPDTNAISAVIRFRTGIVISEQENSIFPFQIDFDALDMITPNEMSRFFANPPVPRPVVLPPSVVESAPPDEPQKIPRVSSFLYIGTAKSNGRAYTLFKDTRTDKILKFSDNLAEKNHIRYSDTGAFLLTYEGTEYEVIR